MQLWVTGGVMAIAAALRIFQYASNRALWADEAVLALNLVERSFGELALPLDYDQGAPLLYLWATKLAMVLLGNTEFALRLVPLVGGLLGLVLFYRLARSFLSPWLATLALVWFSFLRYLLYYATELKQYSTDVTLAIAGFLLVLRLARTQDWGWAWWALTLGGAIAIWASHPVVFVLMGAGATLALFQALDARRPAKRPSSASWPWGGASGSWRLSLASLGIWAASFVVQYGLILRSLTGDESLTGSWREAFPGHPLDLIWVLDALGKFFYKPMGFPPILDGIAIAFFILGCVSYCKRQPRTLALLLSPLGATLLASFLHKYPFRSRLVLFLAPFLLIVLVEGAGYFWRLCRPRSGWKSYLSGAVALGLIGWMVYQPTARALTFFVLPAANQRQEIRAVLGHIIEQQQPQDWVYVFQRGKYQFLYYADRPGYRPEHFILGVEDLDHIDGRDLSEEEKARYRADLDQLRGRDRVWILFSHTAMGAERRFIEAYLDEMGQKIGEYQQVGAFTYLYDFSAAGAPSS